MAAKKTSKANVSKDDLLHYYREMLLIRRFEEKAGQLYGMGLIGGFCHLYIGQEAVVVGLEAAAEEGDKRVTSYRDHGHMLACGMEANGVMAELTGRSGGATPEPEWRTVTGEPTACPEGITDPNAPISSDTVLPCLLPDGSLFPIVLEDGVDGDTDWATMYSTWMEEFRDSLEPCAADVDVNDPMVATCVLPDGTIVGPVPLFAMNMPGEAKEENGWTTALPAIILAALLAYIGAAMLVGWSKRRAA